MLLRQSYARRFDMSHFTLRTAMQTCDNDIINHSGDI
jgi:hypothetical protein